VYRRIQLINEDRDEDGTFRALITGIMGPQTPEVSAAWQLDLDMPRRDVHKNARFYFTEAGWDRFGRAIVAAARESGQRIRVLRTKEKDVDALYRDEWQVMVRPKRKARVGGGDDRLPGRRNG
jgi:hypothetical protein